MDVGRAGPRGFLPVGGVLLAAYRDRLVRLTSDGVVIDLGALPGSRRINLARNNRAPVPDVVAVTEYGAYVLSTDGPPAPLTIPSGLPAPNSCAFLFGFLFFTAGKVESYAQATAADVAMFNRFFHGMLERGVYLAPSAFEAGFMSSAHSDQDIADTMEAARGALRQARG